MPRLRSIVAAAVLVVLSLSGSAAAQVEEVRLNGQSRDSRPADRVVPVGTSMISGTVVAADTGRPVRGARISLTGQVPANADGMVAPSWLRRETATDASGQFSFPRLPAGYFTLSVTQAQFLSTNYGQRRHNGQGADIPLADGQKLAVTIPLQRGGVITGTVAGPDGEPQRNIYVYASRYDKRDGFKRLVGAGNALTDDRGFYRLFNLQPGEYVVSAAPRDPSNITFDGVLPLSEEALLEIERAIATRPLRPPAAPGLTPTVTAPQKSTSFEELLLAPTYLPTYAPSSALASEATVLRVMAGTENAGVDILIRFTPSTIIHGRLLTPLDSKTNLRIRLVSEDPTVNGQSAMWTEPENGSNQFAFRSVRPGKYTIVAQTVSSPSKLWARVPVVVAGEPAIDVNLALQASISVSGVVVFDMPEPPDLTKSSLAVRLKPALSANDVQLEQAPSATVGRDGRFTITGVPPGRYGFQFSGAELKSALVSGQDTLDFPFEFTGERDIADAVLTATESLSELSGKLTDASGKPASGVTIVAAASDDRFWKPGSRRIAVTRPGPDGCYSLANLPAGTYVLAVVMDLDEGEEFDPDFLRSIRSTGVPVTIADGAKVTQNLRVK